MKKQSPFRSKKALFWILSTAIILFLLLFPIPYYIEGPGSAEDVDSMIQIEGINEDAVGTYMLTTISIQKATPLTYLRGYLPFYEILSEEELLGNMGSREEYNTLQDYFMKSSIDSALKAAFDASNLPADLQYHGVHVMSIQNDSDFYGKLKPGDVISGVDDRTFESSKEFTDYVKLKDVGEELVVTIQRNDVESTITGSLIFLEETGKAGIGISLVDQTEIKTKPNASIKAGAIGGPSAGFMFALRTYTLLNDLSLSKDYQIAGTGTIDQEGIVGRIGGIDKKVFAANKEGTTIFFAPDDEITEEMRAAVPDIQSNYEEAVEAAKKIKTKMEIVPIKNLKEAITYLEKMP